MGSPKRPDPGISGVLLAGGRAERLGGIEKGLLRVRGRALLEYPLRLLERCCGEVFLSANRSLAAYRAFGHPVLTDQAFPLAGPLAGIHEALQVMRGEWLLVLPCDALGVEAGLIERLLAAARPGTPALVGTEGERWHPTFSLIHRSQRAPLRDWLAAGERRFGPWLREIGVQPVNCSDHPEWFANLNRPEDVTAAGGRMP